MDWLMLIKQNVPVIELQWFYNLATFTWCDKILNVYKPNTKLKFIPKITLLSYYNCQSQYIPVVLYQMAQLQICWPQNTHVKFYYVSVKSEQYLIFVKSFWTTECINQLFHLTLTVARVYNFEHSWLSELRALPIQII